jgi:processive 1,2-diacylglycerol beta-glucosyltransferase
LRLAVEEKHPEIETRVIDILEFMPWILARIYSGGYLLAANRYRPLWYMLYERASDLYRFKPSGGLHDIFWKSVFRRLFDLLQKEKPDFIVSAHFLSSWLAGEYKARSGADCKVATVITDFGVHPVWINAGQDMVFVATEQLRAELLPFSSYFGTERIEVAGIPIHPRYVESKDTEFLKDKFKLDRDRKTILIMAGISGSDNINRIVSALAECRSKIQVILVGAKLKPIPETLRRKLSQKTIWVQQYGYIEFMDELMRISDLAISKTGGLTSSECLAAGLPLIAYKPYPGQEERNCNYLLEEGAAVRIQQISGLAYKVDGLIEEPGRLEGMKDNALRIARPDAASRIVETLVQSDG